VDGRLDLQGDPLPPGAVARLGSIRWQLFGGLQDPVLSPDGRWLVSHNFYQSTLSGRLHVWEVSTGRLVRSLDQQTCQENVPFPPYAFLPTSKRLLTREQGGNHFLLWEFPSFRLLKRWPARHFHTLVMSPDERFAAGACGIGKPWQVQLLDLRTGKVESLYDADAGQIKSLAFTRDGGLVVVEAVELSPGTVRDGACIVVRIDLLTRRTGAPLRLKARDVSLAPNGEHFVASSWRGGLRLYRVDSGRMRLLPVTAGPLTCYGKCFSPDGLALVTIPHEIPKFRSNGTVIPVDHDPPHAWIWDVDRGELVDRVRLADSAFKGGDSHHLLSQDCRILFLGNTNALVPVSLRTGKPLDDRPRGNFPIDTLRWSAAGREVMADTLYERKRWTTTGRLVEQMQRHISETMFHQLMFQQLMFQQPMFQQLKTQSPDGHWLAVAEEQAITLHDAVTGKARQRLLGHTSEVTTLGWSADGSRLASADAAGMVRLWDVRKGRTVCQLDARKTTRLFAGVLFTPDGQRIVLIEECGAVSLWSAQSGKRLLVLRPNKGKPVDDGIHLDYPLASSVAPRGELLGLVSLSGLRAWSLSLEHEEVSFEQISWDPLKDIDLATRALSFSPDGRFLALLQGGVWLYEVASGRIIHHFPGRCSAAAFHPSRPRLAVAGTKHLDVLVYDLPVLFGSPSPGRRTFQELWADLAHADVVRAQRALWTLAVAPGMEELLAGKLKPVAPLDPGWLKSHLAALRSEDFAMRQKAEQELAEAGDAARAALSEAYRGTGDLEHRLRLQRVLARISPRAPYRLRPHRAILALETRSSNEARRLLARLARGMPGASLTEEAKAALERLTRPAGVAP
jgi:WD40 repeat protein